SQANSSVRTMPCRLASRGRVCALGTGQGSVGLTRPDPCNRRLSVIVAKASAREEQAGPIRSGGRAPARVRGEDDIACSTWSRRVLTRFSAFLRHFLLW